MSALRGVFKILWAANPSRPDPGRREKTDVNFISTLLCDAREGFMKTLKAFIKRFEAQ